MKKLVSLFYFFVTFSTIGLAQTNNLTSVDLVQKAKQLQKQLNLTDIQTNSVTVVLWQASEKFEKLKTKEQHDINKLAAEMAPLRAETLNKIKSFLNAEQAAKFDSIVKQISNTTGVETVGKRPLHSP